MKKIIASILFVVICKVCYGQEILYVEADNGLIIREAPYKTSNRLGKFKYAEKITVQKRTGIDFSIIDNGEKINGEWLYVQGFIDNIEIYGYVFSGFLTDEVLEKRLALKFDDFVFELDHIGIIGDEMILSQTYKDTARVVLDLGETPENKLLKITQKRDVLVEVFQRHENSITIMNEGPHCDLLEWKHFYSEWEKLPYHNNKNTFQTISYSEEDWEKFIPIKINELITVVDEYCGQGWSKLIEEINNVKEYPSGVGMSCIFLKVVLTDKDNQVTEKIIEFQIPMGC